MCKVKKSHSRLFVISIYCLTFAADFYKKFIEYGKKLSYC